MKIRSFVARAGLALTAAMFGCLVSASATSLTAGQRPGQPNLSPEEQSMVKAIMAAPDPAARLKAVEVLIKKHPQTPVRERLAREVANQIASVKDAAQKLTLAQQYQAIFTGPSEQQMIVPILIDALGEAKRFDEAFSSGSEFLTHNPDSLFVLVQLLSIGTDQAKQKNPKFVIQSLRYGTHAIELTEADKKPAEMDDAGWTRYKNTGLPQLYQSMGLLSLVQGDRPGAKTRLTRAIELAPTDAFNHLLLAEILNEEYQDAARHYQSTPNGPAKDVELKSVLASLDLVIDAYAHMIALAEGNERMGSVRQQYLQDFEAYYKYRHHNSIEGMQQLIDKYKTPGK
ncbi:MAG TPA: hypothetical protein VN956_20220 [Pyrinomonadaceae bacterium]|nr:hypothetical protein [Pyrinomonadaceae bacterium]